MLVCFFVLINVNNVFTKKITKVIKSSHCRITFAIPIVINYKNNTKTNLCH